MDDAVIIQQYHELRSCRAVAELYGISSYSVRRVLIKNGIDRTGWKQQPEHAPPKRNYYYPRSYVPVSYDSVCEYCGKEFVSHDKRTRYCSRKCKDIAIRLRKGIACNPNIEPYHKVCAVCGIAFDTFRDNVITCSPACSQKRNTQRWKSKPAHSWDEWVAIRKAEAENRQRIKAKEKEQYQKEHTVGRICEICGGHFYCLDVENRKTCSSGCSKELEKRHRDKRIPKERRIDNISLKRLYERDKGICYICGGKCDWNDWRTADSGNQYPGDSYPTIEHVMPVSLGGLDSWDNVRLACWKCNHEKGASIINGVSIEPAIRPQPKAGAKKTLQLSKDGELIRIWESTSQIKIELGFNDKRIQNVCRGEGKTAFGYVWKYAT